MRFLTLILIAAVLLLAPSAQAQGRKFALVVGIDRYTNLPAHAQLRKAVGDAKAMGETLAALGFAVTPLIEPTRAQFIDKWYEFLAQVTPGDTIAFVFSGHGIELEGTNFLLPRDVPRVRSGREGQLRSESLSFGQLLTDIRERQPVFSFVVLDACRDNPFEEGGKTVGGRRGLSQIEPLEGTFVMFSAGAGQTALDRLDDADTATTSVFTRTLLPLIRKPGVSILDMADQVGEQVRDLAGKVGHRQTPAFYSRVIGGRRLCLAGCGPLVPAVPTAQPQQAPPSVEHEAAAAWASIKETSSTSELDAFIRRFGATFHGDLARSRLGELQRLAMLADEDARRRREDDAAKRKAAEAERKAAEEAARRDPALSVKPGSGEAFRDCTDCPEMVVVPAGNFMMGSPENEPGRYASEGPQRRVAIAKPFAVGKFEVTFDEWDACEVAKGCTHKPEDQGWGRGKRPVINVSWTDAKQYVTWLSKKTGQTYRLLTEAEWEYTARAGTTMPFWWGTKITPAQANYDGDYVYEGGGSKGEDRQKTVPVDSFKPNPWGLYNVHGNVWEWVEDCWIDSYKDAPGDGTARTTGECGRRVLRGGSWLDVPQGLRSADRNRNDSDDRGGLLGFRVARTL